MGFLTFWKNNQSNNQKEKDFPLKYYETIEREIKPLENRMVEFAVSAKNSKRVEDQIISLSGAVKTYYMLKKICSALGEDYKTYFDKMWKPSYVEKYEKELQYLQSNYGELVKKEALHDRESINLERKEYSLLKAYPGILQTEVYKHFGATVRDDIRSIIYFMEKNGQVERVKTGNTYKIFCK